MVTQKSQEFSFKVPSQPILVNVDADKVLLCEKDDQKPNSHWVAQYAKAPLYLDRYEALKACADVEDPKLSKVLVDALDDKFWGIKVFAINNIAAAAKSYPDKIKAKLIKLAEVDKKTQVRQAALVALSTHFVGDPALTAAFFTNALKDSSYLVMGAGLLGLTEVDKEQGLAEAKKLEAEKGDQVKLAIASVYATNGKAEQNAFFQKVLSGGLGAVNTYHMITHYKGYLLNQGDPIIDTGIKSLTTLAEGGERWWIKLNAYVSMLELQKLYVERIEAIKKANEGSTETEGMNAEQKLAQTKAEAIAVLIKGLLAKETDDRIVERIEAMLGV